MTQPQDKMRAEFEAWWKRRQRKTLPSHYGKEELEFWGSGFKDPAWDAWQAACAQQSAQSPQDALDSSRSPSDSDLMDYLCSTKDGVIRMEYPTRFLHWSVDSIHSSPRAAISAAIAARASNGGKA